MMFEKSISLIQELRLRQWARRNYVPSEARRDDEWHPVVLDEMCRRDQERQDQLASAEPVTHRRIVPVDAAELESPSRIDNEHSLRHRPQWVTAPASARAEDLQFLQQTTSSTPLGAGIQNRLCEDQADCYLPPPFQGR